MGMASTFFWSTFHKGLLNCNENNCRSCHVDRYKEEEKRQGPRQDEIKARTDNYLPVQDVYFG
jgi:hypothetical protein